MEVVIRFPGGAKVDAHFGPHPVSTDKPRQAEVRIQIRPHLSCFWPPLGLGRGSLS
jgi:hypothetical protein